MWRHIYFICGVDGKYIYICEEKKKEKKKQLPLTALLHSDVDLVVLFTFHTSSFTQRQGSFNKPKKIHIKIKTSCLYIRINWCYFQHACDLMLRFRHMLHKLYIHLGDWHNKVMVINFVENPRRKGFIYVLFFLLFIHVIWNNTLDQMMWMISVKVLLSMHDFVFFFVENRTTEEYFRLKWVWNSITGNNEWPQKDRLFFFEFLYYVSIEIFMLFFYCIYCWIIITCGDAWSFTIFDSFNFLPY